MMKKSEFSLAETSVTHKPTQKKEHRSQADEARWAWNQYFRWPLFSEQRITTN
ncbi:MAG TPA: hypothetical protein VGW77_09760 [Candidatus Binatia bacterium]|jgi:hypothetical protein|nr:hypothetical protein [Candidatus Binatia bacterium]